MKTNSKSEPDIGMVASLTPLHRSFIGLIVAFAMQFVLPNSYPVLVKLLTFWVSFSSAYLVCCWLVIPSTSVMHVRKMAAREDGNRFFVFSIILLVCLASFAAVFFLIVSSTSQDVSKGLVLAVSVSTMIVSWALLHTVFVFHYARLYYLHKGVKPPLSFPEDDAPDYMDFAYFSFVMGCTFQVSDVSVTDKKMRRVALFHGLLSFAMNTFVIALTVNIISGAAH